MTKSIIFAITALMTILILGTGSVLAQGPQMEVAQSGVTVTKAIPDWLKQSFLWYGEGKTSQEDLLNSMNWMMKENLLHLSDEAAQEVNELKTENRMLKEKIGIDPEEPGIILRPVPGALPELPGFPNECPEIYEPVCGRDGRTYPNECHANDAGVGIVHDGQCRDIPQRECPSGYSWIACAGICVPTGDEHVCPEDHKWSEHAAQCTPDSDQCLCTQQYDPVCGTDGKTYGNKCEAGCADAQIEYEGQCKADLECSSNAECSGDDVCRNGICTVACDVQCFAPDPVCGEDGNTYVCGQADASCHGVEVAHEGECIALRAMPAQ